LTGPKNLKKGDILFREGDAAEAMFVVKSGRIAITKAKGASEILLAELGPGDMLGEMGFFDNKPRSAGAKAAADTVVIELPFAALNAQFKTFPEWLKAIMRTVNTHLRNANQKIKNLERSAEENTELFPAHLVTRLAGVIAAVGAHYGEPTPEGLSLPAGTLRRWTIQVFQLPTNKMQTFMETMRSLGHMGLEDLGEGRQKIVVKNVEFFFDFVNYYAEWQFTEESKRVAIDLRDLKPMKVLIHFGEKTVPDAKDKGKHRVNLTRAAFEAPKAIGEPFDPSEIGGLEEKGLTDPKVAGPEGLSVTFELAELQRLYPFWEIVYAMKKIQKA
jgi:CRP-like cAMP-binding protein